jgi:3-deoxy-D-manno-octulosonic-acid transferase
LIAAQSPEDADRFRALGAAPARVQAVGNIKLDIEPPAARIEQGRLLRQRLGRSRPVWIAASTHPGEEEAALDAHRRVLARQPEAALILVPRHPQRFPDLWKWLTTSGLRLAPRSAIGNAGAPGDLRDVQILFGDSMGEMFAYLAASDIAFVGGSLAAIGGHNVLEPAALKLPVLFGPHMANFMAARELLLKADAALEITDADTLADAVLDLFADADRRTRMGAAGEAAIAANRGALQRLLALLDTLKVVA